MRLLLALSPLLPVAGPVFPGNPVLDPSRIAVGSDTLALAVAEGGRSAVVGTVVLRTWHDGRGSVAREERFYGAGWGGAAINSFVLDARTLGPVRPGGGVLREEGFYPNSIDLVLVALPLAGGTPWTSRSGMRATSGGPSRRSESSASNVSSPGTAGGAPPGRSR